MDMIEAMYPSAVVQCGLCDHTNWALESTALCENCGMDLQRQARLKQEREQPAHAVASSPLPEVETALADAAMLPTFAPPKRHPRRKVWILGGAAALLVVGAGAATAVALTLLPGDTTATATEATVVSVDGWASSPTWKLETSATTVTPTSSGDFVGLVDAGVAKVVDVATGEVVATRKFSDKSTDRMYAAGDMLFVLDGDTVATWAPGDATAGDAGRDSDTGQGSAPWGEVSQSGTESVSLRGDTLFVVGEVGAEYRRVESDATLTPVAVPTAGAVPVAAAGDRVFWATNRGVLFETDAAGVTVAEHTLAPPTADATLTRWVGGDAKFIYVIWDTGDAKKLVAHTTSGTAIAGTATLPEDGLDAALITTRAGSVSAFGLLVIDGTTGAITPVDGKILRAAGDALLVDAENGPILESGGRYPDPVDAPSGTTIVASLDGLLLVSLGDTLAAVAPERNGGAQAG